MIYSAFGGLADIFDMICKTAGGLLWQQKESGGMDGEAYLSGKCFAIIMWDG